MLLESMEQSTKKEITTERKEKRERERECTMEVCRGFLLKYSADN